MKVTEIINKIFSIRNSRAADQKKVTIFDRSSLVPLINKFCEPNTPMTEKEIEQIITGFYDFCMSYYRINSTKPLPKLIMDQEVEDNLRGSYDKNNNTITINRKTIQKLAQNKDKQTLVDLEITISHESAHYHQADMSENWNTLPEADKKELGTYFEVVKQLDSKKDKDGFDYKEDAQELQSIHNLISPYLKVGDKLPAGFDNYESYYEDVVYGIYAGFAHEVDARQSGAFVAKMLSGLMQLEDGLSDTARAFFQVSESYAEKKIKDNDDLDRFIAREAADKFKKSFSAENDTILNFVADVNNLEYSDLTTLYARIGVDGINKILCSFLANKTIEEKAVLLKNAAFHEFTDFGNLCIDSIINDPEYAKKGPSIQADLVKCLGNASLSANNNLNNDCAKLTTAAYKLNFNKILTPEQRLEVVEKLVKHSQIEFASALGTGDLQNVAPEHTDSLKNTIVSTMQKTIKAIEQGTAVALPSDKYCYQSLLSQAQLKDEKVDNLFKQLSQKYAAQNSFESKMSNILPVLEDATSQKQEKAKDQLDPETDYYKHIYGSRQCINYLNCSIGFDNAFKAKKLQTELDDRNRFRDNIHFINVTQSSRVKDFVKQRDLSNSQSNELENS